MTRTVLTAGLLALFLVSSLWAEVVVFVDGSRMEVQRYEVKGGLVVLTTLKGELRSVPHSYVDIQATEQANRQVPSAAGAKPSPPPEPAPPGQPPRPSEAPREEPVKRTEPPPEPAEPQPEPAAKPTAPAALPPSEPPVPPPVWSDEELSVSLVVPSAAWGVETSGASFDVAVNLQKLETRARATLALVRQRMRSYEDFLKVVRNVEASITAQTGYQAIASGRLALDPYTAHEFRYLRVVNAESVFSRVAIFYSRDLAYILSMSCPEDRMEENEADFDALVRGFVIKKVKKEISPKGAPKG